MSTSTEKEIQPICERVLDKGKYIDIQCIYRMSVLWTRATWIETLNGATATATTTPTTTTTRATKSQAQLHIYRSWTKFAHYESNSLCKETWITILLPLLLLVIHTGVAVRFFFPFKVSVVLCRFFFLDFGTIFISLWRSSNFCAWHLTSSGHYKHFKRQPIFFVHFFLNCF